MSDGEQWGVGEGAVGEAFLAHLPLTSCCAAPGRGGGAGEAAEGKGVGDPILDHVYRAEQKK